MYTLLPPPPRLKDNPPESISRVRQASWHTPLSAFFLGFAIYQAESRVHTVLFYVMGTFFSPYLAGVVHQPPRRQAAPPGAVHERAATAVPRSISTPADAQMRSRGNQQPPKSIPALLELFQDVLNPAVLSSVHYPEVGFSYTHKQVAYKKQTRILANFISRENPNRT